LRFFCDFIRTKAFVRAALAAIDSLGVLRCALFQVRADVLEWQEHMLATFGLVSTTRAKALFFPV